MSIFGKTFGDYIRFVRVGLIVLIGTGVLRFLVGVSGVSYERATHLTSMTFAVFVLAIVYGGRAAATRFGGYRHLIPVALLLGATMYGFIIAAILVEGLGGIHGFFHSPGSGFAPERMGLYEHVTGQLSVMPTMTASILGVTVLGYALSRHLAYLARAFLLLAGLAIVRFGVGTLGVLPHAGMWITNLQLAGLVIAAYYAYRAPKAGLTGYGHAALLGFMVAFVVFHLEVFGYAVAEAFGVSTFYNAHATTVLMAIENQGRAAPFLVGALVGCSMVALAVAKRRSDELAPEIER